LSSIVKEAKRMIKITPKYVPETN